MITKDQLQDSLLRECDICLHLYTKVRPDMLEYRPSPGQRSTDELLRYLSYCVISCLRAMTENNWKIFGECRERVAEQSASEFPSWMEWQKEQIREYFRTVPAETLANQEARVPGGPMLPLGAAFIDGPLKWIAAYKLHLFLYLKASGVTDIGTTNVWGGYDKTT